MKYLKQFKTETERSTYKSSSDFILPNVNHVIESDSVDFNPFVPVPQKAGDIVYYVNGSLKTIGYADWKTDLGTPVGVITIPEGFAPDGKARMIALSGETSTAWCPSSAYTDTSLTNYTRVPMTDNLGSTSTGIVGDGYLPSDIFTHDISYVDPVAKYSYANPWIPSPYAGDVANPDYYKEISGYNNTLSDFNGLGNTQTLVELDSTNHQAANHCWTYKDAANSGTQWYLPAMGELGYMMPRFNEINAGLATVSAVQLYFLKSYWSSSEYAAYAVYQVNTGTGKMGISMKEENYLARPWAVVE